MCVSHLRIVDYVMDQFITVLVKDISAQEMSLAYQRQKTSGITVEGQGVPLSPNAFHHESFAEEERQEKKTNGEEMIENCRRA